MFQQTKKWFSGDMFCAVERALHCEGLFVSLSQQNHVATVGDATLRLLWLFGFVILSSI